MFPYCPVHAVPSAEVWDCLAHPAENQAPCFVSLGHPALRLADPQDAFAESAKQ